MLLVNFSMLMTQIGLTINTIFAKRRSSSIGPGHQGSRLGKQTRVLSS